MKFPYDYIALSAVQAFFVGFCAGMCFLSWLIERKGGV